MAEITYLDFDLFIERSGVGYRARVLRCPAIPTACDFVLPFSDLELENFLLKIGHTRRNVRRLESRNVELAKDFGRRLFEATFGDEVRSCLRQSLDFAGQQDTGLRLRLHLTAAPELADLPWEFLYDPALNRFFVLSGKTPLVRYLDLPERIRPLAVQPPIRVIAMISTPSGCPPLDTNREWGKLEDAVADLRAKGLVTVERLEQASLAALQHRLRRAEYHIFHFVGHGGFDEGSQDGVLLLEEETGGGRAVGGQELGMLLHDHTSLRLAILNACEGARASRTDPFAGTAQSLVQQGIPAVIAMQFEVADQTAVLFAHEFYGALADGCPVDTALAEARKAIFARGDGLDWGTPVLYLRAPDGRIFDVASTTLSERPAGAAAPAAPLQMRAEAARDLRDLEIAALEAFYGGDWPRAIALYGDVLAIQPNQPGAAAKLAAASRNRALEEAYAAARQAYKQGDWSAAAEKLGEIVQMEAGYRDAAALLTEVKRRTLLDELYAEARLLAGAGSWEAVLKAFERMVAVDPASPDPDSLLALARERLAAAEQARKLAGLYGEGLRLLDAGQPAEALRQFEAVLALSPGYRQAEALSARARQELDALQEATARQERLADLYARAERAMDTCQWESARGYLEQIAELAPGYRDTDALAARALQALAEKQAAERRQRETDELYARAGSQLRLENWAEAERLCGQILEIQPHYRDVDALLARAQNGLAAQRAAVERVAREAAALPAPPAARPGRPATLPEEIKPRPKPKDLPH
jgi:outer membrane protein assembly factor BamD (BamD/ComL family)